MNRSSGFSLAILLLAFSVPAASDERGSSIAIPRAAAVDLRCPSCLGADRKPDPVPLAAAESVRAPLASAGAERIVFVPVVLSAGGAAGSFYTSELTLTNKGTTPAALDLTYVSAAGGGDGTVHDTLAAGQQKIVPDAIAYLVSLGLGAPTQGAVGTLRVRFTGLSSPGEGFVSVRTTTRVPEGRAGLAYAATNSAAISAGPSLPDAGPIVSGTFRPTNVATGDAFPSPAPTPSSATTLFVFNGTDPNGVWSLYAVDDSSSDSGSIGGGWCVHVATTAQPTARSFCTAEAIQIPGSGTGDSSGAPASPYPSTLTVSGLAGTVTKVTVTLRGYSHTYPDDVDVLVVGPRGQNVIVMSDVGAGTDAVNANLILDDAPPVSVWLAGLRQTASDRSNVAITNPGDASDGDVVLRVSVFSGAGGGTAVKTWPDETLPPGGFKQYSGLLAEAGLTSGYARVERVGGLGRFLAYGVVNDQGNSDGSYVPSVDTAANTGVSRLVVPVIVEAGSFLSELVVTNAGSASRNLTLTYVADAITGGSASVSMTVAAGEQRVIPGFVQWLRDQHVTGVGAAGATFAGALFVSVATGDVQGLVVGARTSAAGSVGRYGLFYTAVPAGGGFTDKAWLFGLQQNSENRTNLALVNTGETDSSTDVFKIELFDGETGQPAGVIADVSLAPRKWTQIGSVLTQGASGLANAYARITRTSGTNPFLAYAVVNDGSGPGERSGDGAFVAPERDCTYSVSGTGRTFGWSGGSTSASLTTGSGCTWDASSDASWIAVTSGSGSGSTSVGYTVASNASASSRTATLTIAGSTYRITQLGNGPGPYDGNWAGTTSQSKPISFTIAKNEMTLLGMGISANLYPCSVSATFSGAEITPHPPVVSNGFSASATIAASGGFFVLNLSGTFSGTSSVSGSASVPIIFTGSSLCFGFGSGPTWTATRQ